MRNVPRQFTAYTRSHTSARSSSSAVCGATAALFTQTCTAPVPLGAFRSNEVDQDHPLAQTLAALGREAVPMSEIMLQQTRVDTVLPRFLRFLERCAEYDSLTRERAT